MFPNLSTFHLHKSKHDEQLQLAAHIACPPWSPLGPPLSLALARLLWGLLVQPTTCSLGKPQHHPLAPLAVCCPWNPLAPSAAVSPLTRFGPWEIPKCLQNGPFWDQKWVKNGSKTHFSQSDPRPFGVLKQVALAHFEPVVMRFGPWKIPKCPQNGAFGTKNGSTKAFFQK